MQKATYVPALEREVTIARRKGTRNLKITMRSDGTIRLSVPYGVPEVVAMRFLLKKKDWIQKQASPKQQILTENTQIGKNHRLSFKAGTAIRTRVTDTNILITHPIENLPHDELVQKAAVKAGEKALKKQAERLLPQRLLTLSEKTGLSYRSCSVKKLKSRWGSCDSKNNIVLNIYLMQLDWPIIDYVIIHELCHTKHPHHQKSFWLEVARQYPNFKEARTVLKSHQTALVVH